MIEFAQGYATGSFTTLAALALLIYFTMPPRPPGSPIRRLWQPRQAPRPSLALMTENGPLPSRLRRRRHNNHLRLYQ